MTEVDKDDHEEAGTEQEQTGAGGRQIEANNNGHSQHRHQNLDEGVLNGNAGGAVTAPAAQKQVTEYGNVFVPGKLTQTFRTMRGRKDYGCAGFRQTQNDDIKKAADDSAKNSNCCQYQGIGLHNGKNVIIRKWLADLGR